MIEVIAIAAGLVAHAVLFFLFFSRRINPMYVLASAFIVVAPISGSSLTQVVYFKYGRVYLTLLMVAIGIFVYGSLRRFGPASFAFMAFVAFYFLGALWSDYLVWAAAYKGLFALAVLSGILLAHSTKSLEDLESGLKWLLVGGIIFAGFILLEFVRNPAAVGHVGRLMAFGINPNRIGQTVAPIVIVAVYLVLYGNSKLWRVLGYTMGSVLLAVIMYTGSRGAAGMALIGSFVLFLPLARRPVLLTTLTLVIGMTALVGLSVLETEAVERLGQIDLNTREGVWAVGIEFVRRSPVWGQGWAYVQLGDQSAMTYNLHSIYLQVLAETGMVGLGFLAFSLLFVAFAALSTWRLLTQDQRARGYAYVAVALLVAVFAHGVIESGSFVGTTANALLLGLAIGLIDHLPRLLHQRWEVEQIWDDEEAYEVDGAMSMPVTT